MIASRKPPGFYGKVPVLGDFVSRRLPAHFVRPWDLWLQDAIMVSQDLLGGDWLEIYLNSPIWRFALSEGTCGLFSCVGILMPSVDKVGRYFPLSLAVAVEEKEAIPWIFFTGDEWFGRLETLALSVLEDDFDLESFDRELQALVPADFIKAGDWFQRSEANGRGSKGRFCRILLDKMDDMRDASVHLNACMLKKYTPGYTLWSTGGSDIMEPTLLAFEGLPPPIVYTQFLAGAGYQESGKGVQEEEAPAAAQSDSPTMPFREVFTPKNQREEAGALRWRSFACSTVGNVRKANEDAYLDRGEHGLWAVADGMGGHKAGGAASKAVVTTLGEVRLPGNDDLDRRVDVVTGSLQRVNLDLIEMAKQFGQGDIVGSTVVALVAGGGSCSVVWVGDSRLYRYRDGNLEQITQDHSLVAELSRRGGSSLPELQEESAISSVLTRALGADVELEIDTLKFEAMPGDAFLLCSDGLIRELSSEEISEILSKGDCEQSSQELINLALTRECRDNVTVIVVRAGSR